MLIRSMFNIQSMSMDLLSGGLNTQILVFFPLHYPSQNVIKGQNTIVWVEFSGGTLIPCSVLPHDQPTLRAKANQKRKKICGKRTCNKDCQRCQLQSDTTKFKFHLDSALTSLSIFFHNVSFFLSSS